MLLSKLGEFGLIERIKKNIRLDASVVKGIGDDCAVLGLDKNHYQLFTCDMLVEGVDFLRKEGPYLIGRKSLAVSISDIAACAGIPRYCLVALGIPKNTRVEFIDRFLKGMLDLAKEYKINLVGGDLSRAGKLTIDVSMLGIVEKNNLLLRGNAKKGDIIFVTGPLGGSIFGKHMRFIPRVKEARFLVKNFKVNSMIDISDGLAADLGHILKQSRKGAIIYEFLVPLAKTARGFNDALHMGEDFELLFTASRKEAKYIARGMRGFYFYPIGEITSEGYGLTLVDKRNREIKIKPKGFRHF